MIEPIVLTKKGEILLDDMPDLNRKDETSLPSQVGIHKFCLGFIKIIKVAKEWKALVCERCNLRVLFPANISTYAELRKYFSKRK